ncbi:MAG TPA: efflux RND transporter permease subunit [Polyangiaceae bacterium]
MFDSLIRFSLVQRYVVLGLAAVVVFFGVRSTLQMPVDVLPELAAPSVTIVTEAEGLAPEEVERLVTIPLEQAVSGAQNVRRMRSSSGIGISLIWVDFDWGVEALAARQIVAERIAAARSRLPEGIEPILAPASSIMGEVMFVGLIAKPGTSPRELRDAAEFSVRRRLLALPGVAQVVPIGGAVGQVDIELLPDRLLFYGLGVTDMVEQLRGLSESTSAGFVSTGAQEYLIRAVGRLSSLEALESVVVAQRGGAAIRLRDVAHVKLGEAPKRGEATAGGQRAVVLKIQKQPNANTLALTEALDRELDEIARGLPASVQLYRKGFRQADFIQTSIRNVLSVLVEAAILVAIVLALFLMNWRATVISLVALPLSLLAGIAVLHAFGASLNTMVLGGFAIAIGELVDDAIIDVENVFRRLSENTRLAPAERRPVFDVVFAASKEIRGSVVYATAVILLVFTPLLFLTGLEGRLLAPLGLAFMTSVAASLVVALTVTPALCLLLLGGAVRAGELRESRLATFLKHRYEGLVTRSLRASGPIAIASALGAAAALIALLTFGRSFLPEFNEGALNIAAATAPGTSLETSDAIVTRLERALLAHPAVSSVIRSTGRAERDEHALDVNYSELEVGLRPKVERARVFAEVRSLAEAIPGLSVTVGQPISHRIEHVVSGSRASVAVKIFGPDLDELRRLAAESSTVMAQVPGTTDVTVEQQSEIPILTIKPKLTELGFAALTPGEVARSTRVALHGVPVGQYWQGERPYEVVVKLPGAYRESGDSVARVPIAGPASLDGRTSSAPSGVAYAPALTRRWLELGQIAELNKTLGPNLINHEHGQRRILVTANIAGRDLVSTAQEIQTKLYSSVRRPDGYFLELGGQFETEAQTTRRLLGLSAIVGLAVFLLLAFALQSLRDALLVLTNLPFALIGGVIAVAIGGGVLTIAASVGFITLFGIATRNGILLVSHIKALQAEGAPIERAIIQGSVDRLVPILMTALTAALALIPIALSSGKPGSEIQGPMAGVILGGLASSTLLTLLVVPAIYGRFSKGARER